MSSYAQYRVDEKLSELDTDIERWENRDFGADQDHVALSSTINQAILDEAMALQPVTIRLQKGLVEDLKMISMLEGLGYQTLIKQVLQRFVTCEMKRIVKEQVERAHAREVLAARQAEIELEPVRKKA